MRARSPFIKNETRHVQLRAALFLDATFPNSALHGGIVLPFLDEL